jgi:hypothetical protein
MKLYYRRTFKRTVKNGAICYAGMQYTSDELKTVPDGYVITVTKFSDEPGCFDISQLLVDAIHEHHITTNFWIR